MFSKACGKFLVKNQIKNFAVGAGIEVLLTLIPYLVLCISSIISSVINWSSSNENVPLSSVSTGLWEPLICSQKYRGQPRLAPSVWNRGGVVLKACVWWLFKSGQVHGICADRKNIHRAVGMSGMPLFTCGRASHARCKLCIYLHVSSWHMSWSLLPSVAPSRESLAA